MRGYWGVVAGLVGGLTWLGGGAALAQQADWSGFELGGSIGATGGYSHVQSQATNKASGNYFSGTDFAQFQRATDDDILQWRPSGGLDFGYTQQYGHILLGVAASANTLFLDQSSQTSEPFQSSPTIRFSVDQRVKADWQATLGPKLGWAQDKWQVFATGGLAVTRATLDATYRDNANFSGFNGTGHSSNTETMLGWALGVGGGYALDSNWALTLKYLYADYGSLSTSYTITNPGQAGNTTPVTSTGDLKTNTVLLGVTYRFKGL
jgi:outer membrane immunogenic protein